MSCVAVTDDAGILVASLSESDLRGVQPADFASLALPVGQWLTYKLAVAPFDTADAEQSVACGTTGGARRDPWAAALRAARVVVTASPDTMLSNAAKSLVVSRLHRLFVVSPDGKPLAVVSLSDILAVCVHGSKPA